MSVSLLISLAASTLAAEQKSVPDLIIDANLEMVYQRYNLAIEKFSHILKIDPKSSQAFYGRGLAYAFQEQHQQAIEDFWRHWHEGREEAEQAFTLSQCQWVSKAPGQA